MQIERQWLLLRLVPDRRNRRSTDELWKLVRQEIGLNGVSKRTVERDLANLQTMFPIEMATEGRTNYWYWGEGVTMWLPGLTDDEALAFNMVERNMRSLLPEVSIERLEPYFAVAKKRLSAPRPGGRAQTRKFRLVPGGVPREVRKNHSPEASRVVRQALLDDRQVVITVFTGQITSSGDDLVTEDLAVNPLGLAQREGELLFIYSRQGSVLPEFIPMRSIDAARASLKGFDGPIDFDFDNYIASGALYEANDLPIASGQWIQLSASFGGKTWQRLCRTPLGAFERISRDTDGQRRITVPIRFTTELAEWLLGQGPDVRVHQPAALRRWIARRVSEAAARYAGENENETPEHSALWCEPWQDMTLVCPKCGWKGQARDEDVSPGDGAKSGGEFRCPGCGHLLLTLDYAAIQDDLLRHWDRLDPGTRAAVLSTPERMERFERERLMDVRLLPTLREGPDFLTWSQVRQISGDIATVIKHGSRLVWVQTAIWNGAEEFERVSAILMSHYAAVIRNVRVSPEAWGFLYPNADKTAS